MKTLYSSILQTLILFSGFLLISCKNDKEDKVFLQMEKGFEMSNKVIQAATATHYKSIESKRNDPMSKEKVEILYPVVESVRKASLKCREEIQTLKDLNYTSQQNNSSIPESSFKKLYDDLIAYKKEVLSLDSEIEKIFADQIEPDSTVTISEFVSIFENAGTQEVTALLDKVENAVHITENNLITFCDYKTTVMSCKYDVFSAIVGQSTNITEGGKEIEIMAGVGAYSTGAEPEFIIDHKKIEVTNGVATLKIKTSRIPGKYLIPVIVKYNDASGLRKTKEIILDYRVSDLK